MKSRKVRYQFRKLRVRKKIFGTQEKPRLAVYHSLKHIYAQLIDDGAGTTLASVGSSSKKFERGTGIQNAVKVGQLLAEKASQKGIKKVVFDRGGRPYQGCFKALADAARKGGLDF